MKRRFAYLALAIALSACSDELPTSVTPTPNPGEDPTWTTVMKQKNGFARLPTLQGRAFDLLANPTSGTPVIGLAPFPGAVVDAASNVVVGVAAFFGPPQIFIASPDFSIGFPLFEGTPIKINERVLLAINTDPGAGPTGAVVYSSTGQFFSLPVPSGYDNAEPFDMGTNSRPTVVGAVTSTTGEHSAARWDYDVVSHTYHVTVLPGPDDFTEARALNTRAGVIVGRAGDHPASWVLSDNSIHINSSLNGRYVDVNNSGTIVGADGTGGGYVLTSATLALPEFAPISINNQGYIVGNGPTGAVLRTLPGPLKTLFAGEAAQVLFINDWGLMGGAVALDPADPGFLAPIVWEAAIFSGDTDRDRVPDDLDNCETVSNGQQEDANNDGTGDVCELGNPPVITANASATTVNEGASVYFTSSATDPFGRRLMFSWSFGDGSPGSARPNIRHVFRDEGTFSTLLVVTNTVEDATQDFTITVANVAPKLRAVADVISLPLGDPVTFTITATDPGLDDVVSLNIDWGDGSPAYTSNCGANTCAVAPSHTYTTLGRFTVTITAQDEDGGVTTVTRVVKSLPNAT